MPNVEINGLEMFSSTFQRSVGRLSPVTGQVFPPTWMGRYPHLMPLDQVIWTRFLKRYGEGFLGFQYDVLLGEGAVPPEDFSDEDKRLTYLLTVKRADCLGISERGLWLVEVKPRLGMACIGQLLAYKELWMRQYGTGFDLNMLAVVEFGEPDLQYVCRRLGFGVVIV